ncbi:MAG: type II toxin-antitoxin system RelB/DinJ family antitoxin [Oscillospiraceae bacterium]|nr:type II toxin-antitoxin system RelB/DinJ family antitoxin [Oscillospiraceae bacterium]
MAAISISINTDSELVAEAQSVFADLGLDMFTAFNLYLKQVVYKQAIPFEIAKPKTENKKIPRSELLGLWKDKVWMADDFDAPLEEMREYME